MPERSASAFDVVANTTGVVVGAIIGSALRAVIRRRDTGEASPGPADLVGTTEPV